jgi:PAS domain S-box-containing protein
VGDGSKTKPYNKNRILELEAELAAEKRTRLRFEKAFNASEKRFRDFVEQSSVGIYRTNLAGEVLFVNDAAARIFEFECTADFMSTNVISRYKNQNDRKELIRLLKDKGSVTGFEIDVVTKKRKVRSVLLSGYLHGNIISGMLMDITERKKNEERMTLLLDISQKIATTLELDELLRIAVERTIELTDLDSVSVILIGDSGKAKVAAAANKIVSIANVSDDLDLNSFKSFKRAIEERRSIILAMDSEATPMNQAELELLKTLNIESILGVPLLARSRVFGIMNFGTAEKSRAFTASEQKLFETIANQLSAMIANAEHYRKTKEAENALRKSEKRFRMIFNDSPIALWEEESTEVKKYIDSLRERGITDFQEYFDNNPDDVINLAAKRNVINVNPAALTLLRAASRETLLKNQKNIFTAETYETWKNWMISVSRGKNEFSSETSLLTLDGKKLDIYVKTFISPEHKDTFERVLISIMDITERKLMENEIVQMQKLESIGILAGGIAHDFNNLLTAILGNINLARLQSGPPEKLSRRLQDAEKAALMAKDLTQQLLTFSSGGLPVKRIVSIVDTIVDSTDFSLRGSNVKSEFNFAPDLWPMEVDKGQISQVIGNIIINADQSMPDGGTITIKAENKNISEDDLLPIQQGRYVKISISDQGTGMSQALLGRIFDPYFTTKQKGSGLGLSTAYSIISKHNGYIRAESKLGVGTTFTIYLPVSDNELLPEENDVEVIQMGSGRVLIMDDEDFVRQVAGELVTQLGYEAAFATNGEEAIRLYLHEKGAGNPFDVVIMDLTVPGQMGGREAIEKLIQIDPQAKAIVSSGYSNDPIMADYAAYGFKEVIRKPFTMKELSDVLDKVMKSPQDK